MASVAKRKWTYNGVEKERWMVRYMDPSGSRRGKSFDLKKDADAFKRKVEREIEDGVHVVDAEAATVARTVDEFLRYTDGRYRDGLIGRTREYALRLVCNRFLVPKFGRQKFRDITRTAVLDYYRELADRYSPITARERIQDMRLVEDFARDRGYIKTEPFGEALKKLRGISPNKIRTFNADEVSRLLEVARTPVSHKRGDRMRLLLCCMTHLAAFCGMRRGEIMALTVGAVDFDRGLIDINHNLTMWDTIKGPKTSAGVRTIPVPQMVLEMIREWLQRHYVPNERQLIFRTSTGRQVLNPNIHAWWRGLLKMAELDGGESFHFHALRHFSASWMIHNGISLPEVAQLLGHSSFDMTLQVYSHAITRPHLKRDVIERMVVALPAPSDTTLTQIV